MDRLIEGVDYFCHFVKFANRANPAMTIENQDGTFDVYFNLLYDIETLRKELDHELRHILDKHFELDVSVQLAELQAEGGKLDIISAAKKRGKIIEFKSPQAFARYIQILAEQRQVDLSGISLQDQIERVNIPARKKKRTQRVKLGHDGN